MVSSLKPIDLEKSSLVSASSQAPKEAIDVQTNCKKYKYTLTHCVSFPPFQNNQEFLEQSYIASSVKATFSQAAPLSLAPLKSAACSCAFFRLAPRKSAPRRSAPWRFAFSKQTPCSCTYCKCAPRRFARSAGLGGGLSDKQHLTSPLQLDL